MKLKFEQTAIGAFGTITIDDQPHGNVSPELAAWIVGVAKRVPLSEFTVEFGDQLPLTESLEIEI